MQINKKWPGMVRLRLVFVVILMIIPFYVHAGKGHGQLSDADETSLGYLNAQSDPGDHMDSSYVKDIPEKLVFFKTEQGVTFGRILDQRMSNLHYTGPGAVLAFSRHVQSNDHISEIGFARGSFHYVKPEHEGTIVHNPGFGLRYMHLKRLEVDAFPEFYLGVRIDLSGNARIAPVLSNSFLFADMAFELQPKARVAYPVYVFNRDWQIHGSASLALFGYGVRIPEYGTSFQITEDGGSAISHASRGGLHPGNFVHINTGAFIRTAIGGDHNPNWLRFGYVWDYLRMEGTHNLNTYHASHQFVVELYFMMN